MSGSIPRPTSTTTADVPSLPPSKCRDCQVVDSSTTSSVVDGILQIVTTKKIVLCPTHQTEDTAPPPLPAHTVPDPPPTAPSSDLPPEALDLSATTETLLEDILTDPDPLNLLDPSPPAPPSPPQLFLLLHQLPPLLHFRKPPSAPTLEPQRKRRKTSAKDIHDLYPGVLHLTNTGTKRLDAIKPTSCSRFTFYKWKPVAEVKIISPSDFTAFEENSETLTKLLKQCLEFLKTDTLATSMRRSGELLE